jgi:predicted RNA polymerase sigma factor
VTAPDVRRTIEALGRTRSPRLIAGLVRIVRDVGAPRIWRAMPLVAALER